MVVLLGCNPSNAYGLNVVPGYIKTIRLEPGGQADDDKEVGDIQDHYH
jgi:hypothetical protein